MDPDLYRYLFFPAAVLPRPVSPDSKSKAVTLFAARACVVTYTVFDEADFDPEHDWIPTRLAGRNGAKRLSVFELPYEGDPLQVFVIDTVFVKVFGILKSDYAFVAFRGTKSARDWIVNTQASPMSAPKLADYFDEIARRPNLFVNPDIRLHYGFYWMSLLVYELVVAKLAAWPLAGRRLVSCGHSLGGVFAAYFAARFGADIARGAIAANSIPAHMSVTTFGMPRFGAGDLSDFVGCGHNRYMFDDDIVPSVPSAKKYRHDVTACMLKPLSAQFASHPDAGHALKAADNARLAYARLVGPTAAFRAIVAAHSIERYFDLIDQWTWPVGAGWEP